MSVMSKADLVLKISVIWTVDHRLKAAEAVAIQGKKILAVGSDEEIELLIFSFIKPTWRLL